MRVAIVHNRPAEGKPDSEDVLIEADLVTRTMGDLGHDAISFTIDTGEDASSALLARLGEYAPDAVFNLVESVGEDQTLYPAAASLLHLAGYAFTGSPFHALHTTTDKILTKAVLAAYGIPTPPWQQYRGQPEPVSVPLPCILKPAWEDASVGIDDGSVCHDGEAISAVLPALYRRFKGQPILIEHFLQGREFNLSLLERPDGSVEVLPAAEIIFRGWPKNKPRIVNYRAKWDHESFEYHNTVRMFPSEGTLTGALGAVALRCWDAFRLSGYARVDLRLDGEDRPFVIEVNTNPCISPDAGFLAAAREAGYAPADVIDRILTAALNRNSRAHGTAVAQK